MADTIVRLFDRPVDALRAVDRLRAMGIDEDDISLVANNREGWYDENGLRHDRLSGRDGGVAKRGMKDDDRDGDDDRLEGAGDGATAGGLIGGGAGLLAGLGMLAVPGLGPVVAAGWLASTAAGAAAGAIAGGVIGGIVGALTHEGVEKKDAEVYAESIRRGGAVVVVRNQGARRRDIEQALSDYNSADAGLRGDYYRSSGWAGYDETAPDFEASQIESERDRAAAYRPGTRM
jgi:hypothetical protein